METKQTEAVYTCASCGKQGEVAFRLNNRNPEKISRATPDTPKPLCLSCVEQRRKEINAEKQAEKQKTSASLTAVVVPESADKPKEKTKAEKAEKNAPDQVPLGDEDVLVNWRWHCYSKQWTKKKPTISGDYWIWVPGDLNPTLRKVTDHLSPTMVPFMSDPKVWFLGPIDVPPTPEKCNSAALQQRMKEKMAMDKVRRETNRKSRRNNGQK